MKYSAFGVPYLIPPGDADYDGELTIFDNMEFGNRFSAEDHRADLNLDGVFDTFDYLDFGNALYSGEVVTRGALSRLDIENRIGYAGAVWDSHLNLWVMRHRLYDPARGRFLQRDPIGYAGGWNLYEYCNSQPMDWVDPWGLEPVTYWEITKAFFRPSTWIGRPATHEGVWGPGGTPTGPAGEGWDGNIELVLDASEERWGAVPREGAQGTPLFDYNNPTDRRAVGMALFTLNRQMDEVGHGAVVSVMVTTGVVLTLAGPLDDIKLAAAVAKGGYRLVKTGAQVVIRKVVNRGGKEVLEELTEAEAKALAREVSGEVITDPSRLLPAPKKVQHHLFPAWRGNNPAKQKYRDFFKQHGIDVDEYVVDVMEETHKGIHGKGNLMEDWRVVWEAWIDQHPNATTTEVYQRLGQMMDEYGLSSCPIHRFNE